MGITINHKRFVVNHERFIYCGRLVVMRKTKDMDIKNIVADNIKKLATNRYASVNQTRLCEDSGVAQSTIGRIVKCETAAKIDTVDEIAREFGIDAWRLLAPGLGKDMVEYQGNEALSAIKMSKSKERLMAALFNADISDEVAGVLIGVLSISTNTKTKDKIEITDPDMEKENPLIQEFNKVLVERRLTDIQVKVDRRK